MSLRDTVLPVVPLEGPDGLVKPSRMRDDERLAATTLAVATALACVAILVLAPSRVDAPGTIMGLAGVALIACAGTYVAARRSNRLLCGIALLAAGFLGPGAAVSPYLVIPHYGVAMWMVIRQNRLVKDQGALRRQNRSATGGTRRGSPPPAPGTRRKGRGSVAVRDARPMPTRSKRYTPPAPKRRSPPKPDRDDVDDPR